MSPSSAESSSPALPAWLSSGIGASYEPRLAREGFLRKNVLTLTSLLARLRMGAAARECPSPIDRVLARVAVPARLLGLLALISCVSVARNILFVYLVLGVVLVLLAVRPAAEIVRELRVLLPVCLASALVMLPAALFGQPVAAARTALKSFASLGLVLGLFRHIGWLELLGRCAACTCPAEPSSCSIAPFVTLCSWVARPWSSPAPLSCAALG